MARQKLLPGLAIVALLLALAAQPGQAQVFKLEHAPSPAPFSLTTHYIFYVYQTGAPASAGGAQASVEFRKLAAHQAREGQPPSGYGGLEVSILPYDRFWDLVNRKHFCSGAKDARLSLAQPEGATLEEVGVRTQGVPLGSESESAVFPIKTSGKYILAVSNCGNYSEATLTGSIAVRNAHGYLPAYEFNAMRIAGWLTVIYTAIFGVWTGVTIRHSKTLLFVQKGILVISLVCALEAFCTWLDHQDWNTNGNRRDPLFLASLVFYTLKYVLAWRLLLLASLGSGLVFEDLDTKTSIIFLVTSSLFMIQSCAWRLIVSYRYGFALDPTFLLLMTFPGIVIYTGLFGWTLMAISNLTTRLTEQKQEELVGIFGKVRVILVIGLLLSAINATVQIVDMAMGLFSWNLAWVSVDGTPQFSFMALLVAMMVVWWPTEDSWKYGYQVQTNVPEDEESAEEASGARIAMADDNHIQVDSPRAKVGKKLNTVAPEAIGAPEGEEGEDLL